MSADRWHRERGSAGVQSYQFWQDTGAGGCGTRCTPEQRELQAYVDATTRPCDDADLLLTLRAASVHPELSREARALGRRRTTADKMELEARTVSAAALAAGFRGWNQRTIGEGWGKMTAWVSDTYAAVTTQFHQGDIRRNLDAFVGGTWRYIGACPRAGVRVFARA